MLLTRLFLEHWFVHGVRLCMCVATCLRQMASSVRRGGVALPPMALSASSAGVHRVVREYLREQLVWHLTDIVECSAGSGSDVTVSAAAALTSRLVLNGTLPSLSTQPCISHAYTLPVVHGHVQYRQEVCGHVPVCPGCAWWYRNGDCVVEMMMTMMTIIKIMKIMMMVVVVMLILISI